MFGDLPYTYNPPIARIRQETGRCPLLQSVIQWIDVKKELPDDETTVLVALFNGEIWLGFKDGDTWREVSADPLPKVTHWANLPEHPTLK
jgi:hypothetical protein